MFPVWVAMFHFLFAWVALNWLFVPAYFCSVSTSLCISLHSFAALTLHFCMDFFAACLFNFSCCMFSFGIPILHNSLGNLLAAQIIQQFGTLHYLVAIVAWSLHQITRLFPWQIRLPCLAKKFNLFYCVIWKLLFVGLLVRNIIAKRKPSWRFCVWKSGHWEKIKRCLCLRDPLQTHVEVLNVLSPLKGSAGVRAHMWSEISE